MLILFDIDGTLLASQGAGTRSMHAAARELFGEQFTIDHVEIAGRIDPLIWADMAKANGITDPEAQHDRFRAAYARHLAVRLDGDQHVSILPGVRPLLEALGEINHLTLGLLTGNYPETARLKLLAAGVDPGIFPVAAWGCDAGTRDGLPGVAMARHAQTTGTQISPDEVIIIGDTPHDVGCAQAHGCRSLAVATGTCSRRELAACSADWVVDDLSDTAAILTWLGVTRGDGSE